MILARIVERTVINLYPDGDLEVLGDLYPNQTFIEVADYVKVGQAYPFADITFELDTIRRKTISNYEDRWGKESVIFLWPELQKEMLLDAERGNEVNLAMFPSMKGFISIKLSKNTDDITIPEIKYFCDYLRRFQTMHIMILVKTEEIRKNCLTLYDSLTIPEKLEFSVIDYWNANYNLKEIIT